MSGIWTRNYYNMITASLGSVSSASSSDVPTDYSLPIRLRLPNGQYTSAQTSDIKTVGVSNSPLGMNMGYMTIGIGSVPAQMLTSWTGFSLPNNIYYGLGIILGNGGSGEVSYDDYALKGNIIGGLNFGSVNGAITQQGYDEETHSLYFTRMFTMTNGGTSNVTFNEIALAGRLNTLQGFMIYHEMLDEAITLESGESLQLMLNVNTPIFNYTPYPTA